MTESGKSMLERLKRLLQNPRTEWARTWPFVWRLAQIGSVGARQLREHRARQLAAALAFHTILGLIPLVVLAVLMFRAFGGTELLGNFIEECLEAVRLDQVSGPEKGTTLSGWARGWIEQLNADVSARAVGVVGLLVFGWAAIGLLSTIERSFNMIYNAPENRPLIRCLPLYWTAVTAGPALLYLSFQFQNRLVTIIQDIGVSIVPASAIGLAASLLSTWLFLLLLYELMPHAKVDLRAAAAGSFVGAVLWIATSKGLGAYVSWSFGREGSPMGMVYGALGLVPLFLIWIYIMWLVVLFGLEITRLLQTVGWGTDKSVPIQSQLPPLTDPAVVIPIVRTVSSRFDEGRTTTVGDVVEHARLSERAVSVIFDALAEARLLRRVEDVEGQTAFTLARPADSISTRELLDVTQKLTLSDAPDDTEAWRWVRQFREAQLQMPLHRPLAGL
jgi:membrane protein